MEWYWTTLIIIGYIFMICLTAYLLNKFKFLDIIDSKSDCLVAGIIWPLVYVFILIGIPITLIVAGIEGLANLWESWENKKSKK
jgi:Na+/proline symporter